MANGNKGAAMGKTAVATAAGSVVIGTLLLATLATAQNNLVDAPIPHATGQSVSASFEGWYPIPDELG